MLIFQCVWEHLQEIDTFFVHLIVWPDCFMIGTYHYSAAYTFAKWYLKAAHKVDWVGHVKRTDCPAFVDDKHS